MAPVPLPAAPVPDPELARMLAEVEEQYMAAREHGQGIRLNIQWTGSLDCVDAVDNFMKKKRKPAEPGPDDDVFVGNVRDESKMAGWRKLKNGITMDSGSAVDITPDDENPEFPIVDLTGPGEGDGSAQRTARPLRSQAKSG